MPPRSALPAADAPPVQRIASVVDLWTGEQLRERRKALGRPLADVARACGISVSLLSQIERGLRSISPRTLAELSAQLGVPIERLGRGKRPSAGQARGMVGRAGRHRRIDQPDQRIVKENLTPPAATGAVELFRAVIQPGGSTGDVLFNTRPGEQIGYVIDGELELLIRDRVHRLRAGDSFCYDGNSPRRWRNPGPSVTTVLWAIPRAPQ